MKPNAAHPLKPVTDTPRRRLQRSSSLLSLEQRFMFDGAAVATAADALPDAPAPLPHDVPAPVEVRAADPALDNGKKEVVFIESNVTDYQSLLEGVRAGVEVVILDAAEDGLAQMAKWAQSHSGYDAIYVISHGSEGQVELGTLSLDTQTASEHALELATIGASLTADGDLLLYGCNVATGAGQDFIDTLTQLSGADVAASTDPTGAASLGGDWQLEAASGSIEAEAALNMNVQQSYAGLLGTNQTFGFEGTVSGFNWYDVTNQEAGGTLKVISLWDYLYDAKSKTGETLSGNGGLLAGWNFANETYLRFEMSAGESFNLTSITLKSYDEPESIVLTSSKGETYTCSVDSTSGTLINLPTNIFQGITWFTITEATPGEQTNGFAIGVDDIVLQNITLPAPEITSATYNANTHVLSVSTTTVMAGDSIDTSKLTLRGQGGSSYTLTSGIVTATSGGFSVNLNATDQSALASLLTQNGTQSSDGITYNIAAASGWDSSRTSNADTSGNVITVSNSAATTITSASYDAQSNVLSVTGSGLVAGDIIDTNKLTLTGQSGSSYTLSSGQVIATATGFSITLNATDQSKVETLLNQNGTLASSGYSYNLSGAANWDSSRTSYADTSNGVSVTNMVSNIYGFESYLNWNFGDSTLQETLYGETLQVTGAQYEVAPVTYNNYYSPISGGESLDLGANYSLTTATFALTNGKQFTLQSLSFDASYQYSSLTIKTSKGGAIPISFNGSIYTGYDANFQDITWFTLSDGYSGSSSITLEVDNIALNNIHFAAPSFSSGSTSSFAENASGTAYTAAATSSNGTMSYSLSGTDASLFNINSTTGAVTFKNAPDYDTPADNGGNNAYNINVIATDSIGSTSQSVVINVTNVNETPNITSGSIAYLAENSSGTAYTATGIDPDAGQTLSWSLSGSDAGLFNIDSSTGAVSFKNAPDYENPLDAGADNNYSIIVNATDNGGLVTTKAVAIVVTDVNEPPVVTGIVRSGGAAAATTAAATSVDYTVTFDRAVSGVDVSDFTVTGTGTAGGSIANVSGSGTTYTVTVTGLSGDGSLGLALNSSGTGIQDGNGLDIQGGYTSGATYTLDHTAPNAPATPDMTAGTDTGSSSSDNLTNNAAPTFTGTAESGATVTLYDTNGTTVLGTTTATGGNWSITSAPLSEGSHTLTATATDAAGNTSAASSSLAIVVDNSPPSALTASATTIASSTTTSGATIATLSATDAQTITYGLAIGNGSNDADNGRFSISGNALQVGGTALTAGTYHLYVKATDAAGNVIYQALTLTIVDAPSVTSIVRTGGASSTVATATTSINYTITFSQAVTGVDTSDFALTATGTAAGSIASVTGSGTTYTVTINSLSGDGTLRLDLNGSATGIQNGSSVNIIGGYASGATYMLDHTPPGAPSAPDMTSGTDTGVSTSDNLTNNTSPTFTGTAESGATVTLYDTDGTTVLGTATADGAGNWAITSSVLGAGSHTLSAKATDAAGNVSAPSAGLSTTIDTAAPGIASVTVPSNYSYQAGQTLSFTVNSSEAITVDTSGGTPRLALDIGGATAYASYVSGSGSTVLVFYYTVQAGDTDSNGIAVTALQSNGGSLRDSAGNGMTLTLNNVASTAGVLVDTTAPTVTSVAVPANGTYYNGQNLDFTVNFAEAVTVYTSSGTPRIAITLDTGGTVYANYVSGSGTSALVFRHVVANGEKDTTGITLGALVPSGSTLCDSAGNDATLTLNSIGSTAAINVDGTQPSILNVTSSTADGSYRAGDSVSITLTFSTAVTVDTNGGTPTLDLGSGGTATYAGGSGSTALTFVYTVTAGQNSADLDYSSTAALSLNGATIRDSGGSHQDATLTLFSPGTAGSLGANKAIVVDTTPPTISFSNTGLSADTGSSATDFITAATAQTITATLSGAPAGTDVVYGSLDGGATWTDITSKITGTTLTWDGVTLTGNGTLMLKVTDAAGNDGASHSQTYTLDTSAPTAPAAPDLVTASDSGSSNSDKLTNTTTPTLTGTAEAGSSVTLYDSDGSTGLGTATTDGAGNWSITSTVLSTGNHTLTARATDAAGNTSVASAGLTLSIDTTAPTAPTAPDLAAASDSGSSDSDNLTRTTTPTLTGTAEAGSSVTLYDSDGSTALGTATTDGAGNWSITSAALSAGSHTLTAKATDAAGNTSPASTGLILTIDTAAPTAPTTPDLAATSDSGSSDSDNITRTTTPTITGTAEAGSRVTLYDSDGTTVLGTATTDGAGNWSITSTILASGSHTLTARATDAAGNTSVASAGLTVGIDTAAPSVSLTTLSAGNTTPVLSGSANEGTLTITVGGATYNVIPAGGVWHLDLATAVPTSGSLALQLGQSYSVAISATDAAGNTSSTTQTLTLTVVPNPPMPQPVGPSFVELTPPPTPLPAPVAGESPVSFLSPGTEAAFNEIPGWLTSSSGGVVSPDNGYLGALLLGGKPGNSIQGLVVNRAMPDQVFESTGTFEIRVPSDTFANFSSDADVQLLAAQANGRPLPNWIKFDPAAGKFIVQAPPGVSGELTIRLVARDRQGNEALTTFKIRVGSNRHASFERSGRPGLSEQVRLAAHPSVSGLERLRAVPDLRELRELRELRLG